MSHLHALSGRQDEMAQFYALLDAPEAGCLAVEGPSSMGKSMLMQAFRQHCLTHHIPHLYLDLRVGQAANSLTMLTALRQSGVLAERPVVNQPSSDNKAQPRWKKAVHAMWQHGFSRSSPSPSLGIAPDQAELSLLYGLVQQGAQGAVLLVDSADYMQSEALRIDSALNLASLETGHPSMQGASQSHLLVDFLAALIQLLAQNGWRVVVAGRTVPDILPLGKRASLTLTGLDIAQIAQDWPVLHSLGQTAEAMHAASLGGQPLWLNILISVLAARQQDDSSQAGSKPLLADFDTADAADNDINCADYPIKSNILSRLLASQGRDMAQASRLALPLTLSIRRLQALFPDEDATALLRDLHHAGLLVLFDNNDESVRLHDAVRDTLLHWSRTNGREMTKTYRDDHRVLLEVLKQERPDLADLSWLNGVAEPEQDALLQMRFASGDAVQWSREATRHACLASQRVHVCLRGQNREFLAGLMQSIGFHPKDWWLIASSLEKLNRHQLGNYFNSWSEESQARIQRFGDAISKRLMRSIRLGELDDTSSVDWWLQCVQAEQHHPSAYYGLFSQNPVWIQTIGFTAETIRKHAETMLAHQPSPIDVNWLRPALEAWQAMANALCELEEYAEAASLYDMAWQCAIDHHAEEIKCQLVEVLCHQADCLAELGDAQAQVAVYNKLLAHFAEADSPDIQEWVACSLIKQAKLHAQLGKPKAEMACYTRLVKQFADSELPYVQEQLALALLGQGHIWRQRKNLRAAVACYDQLLAHFAGPHTPFIELQCANALSEKADLLVEMGETAAAIACHDMLVHRFADHPEFAIQLQLASSLISQAQLLYADQQPTAALACFDRLRDIFADHPDPNVQTTVLGGLHSKAMLQRILGEWEAMSATCDELCRLFGDKPEPAMQEAVANVLFWQAGCLRQRRSSLSAAIAVYDVLVQRVTLNRRPVMQMLAARAWQYQGAAYEQLGDATAASVCYTTLVRRFSRRDDAVMRECITLEFAKQATALIVQNMPSAALAVHEWLLRWLGISPREDAQDALAKVLFNRAQLLHSLHDLDAELACHAEILHRFADSECPKRQTLLAKTLCNQAACLRLQNQVPAAIAVYQTLLARYADSETPQVQHVVAHARRCLAAMSRPDVPSSALLPEETRYRQLEPLAMPGAFLEEDLKKQRLIINIGTVRHMLDHGVKLEANGQFAEAIDTYNELLFCMAGHDTPDLQEAQAQALYRKAFALGKQENPSDQLAVYQALSAQFIDSTAPAIEALLAKAMLNQGALSASIQGPDAAIAVYQQLIQRFARHPDIEVQQHVAHAYYNTGCELGQQQDLNGAIASYNTLLKRFGYQPAMQEVCALGLCNRAAAYYHLGQRAEEQADYLALIRLLENHPLPQQDLLHIDTLLNYADTLDLQGDSAGKMAVYEAAWRRFADHPHPDVQAKVAHVLYFHSDLLIRTGKTAADPNIQASHWRRAQHLLRQALDKPPFQENCTLLSWLAYVCVLLGEDGAARPLLSKALATADNSLYADIQKNLAQHPIAADHTMRAMVEEVWESVQQSHG